MPSLTLSKPIDLRDTTHASLAMLGGSFNRTTFLGHEPGSLLCTGVRTTPDVQPVPDTGTAPEPLPQAYSTRGTITLTFDTDWKSGRMIPGPPIDFSESIKPYDGWTLNK